MDDLERRLKELGDRTAEQVRHGEVPRARIARRVRLRRGAAAIGTCAVVALVAAVAIPRLGDARDARIVGTSVDLAAVAQATEDAGSARIAVEMTIDVSGRQAATTGTGVVDFERARSHFRMKESGLLGTEDLEIVSIGRTTYQRSLGGDGEKPSKWYETKTPAAGAGVPAFGLGTPSDFLSSLTSISNEVTDLGKEVLDGVTVTHYRAEIDFPDAAPAQLEIELEPMDVWIDEEGRLRRLTFTMTTTGGPAGSTNAEATMRLWDFGVPVDVAAPDPGDVTDDPPPAIGAAPGMEDSVSEEGTGGLDEYGVDELLTVAGEEGLSGPYAVVTISDTRVAVCIQGAVPATSRSLIVEVASDEPVVSISGDPEEDNPYARGGCTGPRLSTDLADRLREDPELFELRFERAEAPDVVVPLTQSF